MSVESYHPMGRSQQEANQAMLHKGNTEYLKTVTERAHRGLGTVHHGSIQSEVGFSGSEAAAIPGPKHIPGFREGTMFLLISGPQGKALVSWLQAITATAKHVSKLEKGV